MIRSLLGEERAHRRIQAACRVVQLQHLKGSPTNEEGQENSDKHFDHLIKNKANICLFSARAAPMRFNKTCQK